MTGTDVCGGLGFLVRIIRDGIFPIVQIGIPIILIVLGTIDLGKAVISSDEKQVKEAQSRLIKRCVYAIAIFFIVTIVRLVFSTIANISEPAGDASGFKNWWQCWEKA